MAKEVQLPYVPTPPPLEFRDWHRWIDDELNRVRVALQIDPVNTSVSGSGTVGITTTTTTEILGFGDLPLVENPEGIWDPVLATWTCPVSGLYSFNVSAVVSAFGAGQKSYQAALEVQRLSPNPATIAITADGGDDDVPLGVTLAAPLVVIIGDVLQFVLTTLHEQFTGSTNYTFRFSVFKTATPK